MLACATETDPWVSLCGPAWGRGTQEGEEEGRGWEERGEIMRNKRGEDEKEKE